MNDVALIYTHGESVKSVFMDSVIGALLSPDTRPHIGAVRGFAGAAYIASCRNQAARWFLGCTPCTWLWFVDGDTQIKPTTLPQMLDLVDGEPCVATAAYYGLTRPDEQEPVLVWATDTPNGLRQLRGLPPHHPITELDACGAGCMLIHRNVLDQVAEQHQDDPYPWFAHDIHGNVRLGEDFTFCMRAKQAGIRVLGLDIIVEHYKLQPVPWQTASTC